MSILTVRGLTKAFEGNEHVLAVDGLDLTLERGEVLGLLGPSGCGKTTTLRCIAGLETPSTGTITLNGKTVVDGTTQYVPTEKRDLGMVFQSYALWPHLTVYENVEFPLIYSNVEKSARPDKIRASLEAVGLGALSARYPGELSGGQQQRVAVARAIVAEPSLVLFDEPLSNLDARLRNRVRVELKMLLSRLHMTALYVTHDQSEAMALCDRIAVMSGGRILQIGTPEQVYETPNHLLVAQFLGDANILPFTATENGSITIAGEQCAGTLQTQGRAGQVVLRPEHLVIMPERPAGGFGWAGTLTERLYLGSYAEHLVTLDHAGLQLTAHLRERKLQPGQRCFVMPDLSAAAWLME